MAELVDAQDLKSWVGLNWRASSILALGTKYKRVQDAQELRTMRGPLPYYP